MCSRSLSSISDLGRFIALAKQCDEKCQKNVEWASDAFCGSRDNRKLKLSMPSCSRKSMMRMRPLLNGGQAKPGEASMDNPRCDVVVVRGQKQAVFPPKLQVGQQLAKLVNWEGPIRVELEAGENLASFLGRLFAGGGTLSGNGGENGERSRQTVSPASGVRR